LPATQFLLEIADVSFSEAWGFEIKYPAMPWDNPDLLAAWLRAFLLTQVIEVPLYVAAGWKRASPLHLVAAGAACTAITHPLLWFVWPHVVHDYTAFVISGEIAVTLAESGLFFLLVPKISLARAAGAAFVANGSSYGIGELLRAVGWFS